MATDKMILIGLYVRLVTATLGEEGGAGDPPVCTLIQCFL